jgi:alpha-glucosidase
MTDVSAWWREAVIYQIYPRSWRDSGRDGVGDLPGIVGRLDHLSRLGATAVWVSPFYPSPMADFGYDVTDYTGVDALFGTLEDAQRLIEEAHAQGLKVVLDFVPNHSSDRHPWFEAARASREDPHRDWYLWADPAPGGGPPNNWLSASGGPAWTLDEGTGQYYLHSFLPQQPDLNWRNPAVREAMLGAMRFWLDRGVDGFRLDVVYRCIKDAALRDDPPNPDFDEGRDPPFAAVLPLHSADRPEVMDLVVEPMRRLVDTYGDRCLIGEIYLPLERLVEYYGTPAAPGIHLPFNFSLVFARWEAAGLRDLVRRYESLLPQGAWPNWVLGNHDQPRVASRLGDAQARAAMVLLMTLRGTPTLYYGDEIGMHDVPIPPDRVRDPWELRMPGVGEGRDPCRTPMRWAAGPTAGFCPHGVEPWLPMGGALSTINVAAQAKDPRSMLSLTRALLRLRRERAALRVGAYGRIDAEGEVLVLTRERGPERLTVALNLSGEPAPASPRGRVLISTQGDRGGSFGGVLRPDEAVVLEAGTGA